MQTKNYTRRFFLQQNTKAALALALSPVIPFSGKQVRSMHTSRKPPQVFLFQGDSITDGNRGRNNDPNHIMGHGYAFSIASRAGAAFPEKGLTFFNRGVSGNTVEDLRTRWRTDTLDIKPDVLSILVGINNTDRALQQKASGATAFEAAYRDLLAQTKAALPNCLLVVCEPFLAPVGRVKKAWSDWQSDIKKKQEAAQRLAEEIDAVWVPLQDVFDKAASRAPAAYWIWDGIHPTVAGHELIVQQWLSIVGTRVPFLKALC